jgi:large subunit ribosomal protein L6
VVKGPKGQLSQSLPAGVTMVLVEGQIVASVGEAREQLKFHGLGRRLVANAVQGVSEGF